VQRPRGTATEKGRREKFALENNPGETTLKKRFAGGGKNVLRGGEMRRKGTIKGGNRRVKYSLAKGLGRSAPRW